MEKSKYVSVAEAREILGVSKPKMADMLKKSVLQAKEDPLDGRAKLILRTEVEALAADSAGARKNAA